MILGLALLGLGLLLGYEIFTGNAVTIIDSFRGITSGSTSSTTSTTPPQVLTPSQTPQVGGPNAPGQSNPSSGMA